MGAFFDNPVFGENQDRVGIFDGGQPMSNGKGRSTPSQLF